MNDKLLRAFRNGNLEAINDVTKIIAYAVRNELEDFHIENIPNHKMKELNTHIRTGIFNTLIALANYKKDQLFMEHINFLDLTAPKYWELPLMNPAYKEKLSDLLTQKHLVLFKSDFLNEQFKLGNLYFDPQSWCLKLKVSCEFKNVDYDNRHQQRGKISAQLRKEGYNYDQVSDGYTKD